MIQKGSKFFELAYPLTNDQKISVFDKSTYSIFKIPGLVAQIKISGVTRLVLCGVQTDKCLLASACDGFDLGFELTVLEDACCSRKKTYKGDRTNW